MFLLFTWLPALPRWIHFCSVSGLYVLLAYVKPEGMPFSYLLFLPCIASFAIYFRPQKENFLRFIEPLKNVMVLSILAYAFCLFFFRWEPPGSDPIKWGSLAKILLETNVLPGNTWPITEVRDLRGASFGIPVLIALMAKFSFVPIERSLFFLECLGIALFTFAITTSLKMWFTEKVALLAAAMALVVFTQPQNYLGWGGTPTLYGMLSGLMFLPLLQNLQIRRTHGLEGLAYGFAVAFSIFAHPVGVYVSGCVLLPVLIDGWWRSKNKKLKLATGFGVFVLALLLASPFLNQVGDLASGQELAEIRRWQHEMSPFLFREQNSLIYNLYTQVTAYLWNTSSLVALTLFLVFCMRYRAAIVPGLSMIAIASLLILNAKTWWFPLSQLLYPERVATMLVLPFSLGFAMLCDYCLNLPSARKAMSFVLLGTLVLGTLQFKNRLWPFFLDSRLLPRDHKAMATIRERVPPEECVQIQMPSAAMWIPVLAYRCTVPFHGLGMQTFDEERKGLRPAPWKYEDFL